MSFICGDCHKEHPVPTREEDRNGQPCVDALVRERDSMKLQVEQYRKIVEIAKTHQCAAKRYEIDGKPLTRCELCDALAALVEKRICESLSPVDQQCELADKHDGEHRNLNNTW
jgi:hypothetical protein